MHIGIESHLDHGLTDAHLAFIRERFGDRLGFFVETVEMPAHLPDLHCALYGPCMGDAPVTEHEVAYTVRPPRTWCSRIMFTVRDGVIVMPPARPTRLLTVIAGPDKFGGSTVLYTAFGGPAAPQEPGDPNCLDPEESNDFWCVHALTLSKP